MPHELLHQYAGLLSHMVLDRTRKGLYRTYLTWSEHLHYVRSRLEVQDLSLSP